MFYLYEKENNFYFYETSCLESLTKRYRSHGHEITISWEEKIPNFILEVFSKFFNFTYKKSDSNSTFIRFSFDKNGSDYIPSIVFRLIRDRGSFDLTNDIIKEGMDSIIAKLVTKINFKKELLFYDYETGEPDFLIPKEFLFAVYLKDLKKYDAMLESIEYTNGIIGALYSLLIDNKDFKMGVINILKEYYSEKPIELRSYKMTSKNDYSGFYEELTVDINYIIDLINKWVIKRKGEVK